MKLQKNRKIMVPIVGLGEKVFELKEIVSVFFVQKSRGVSVYAKNDAFTQIVLKIGIKCHTMQATCSNGENSGELQIKFAIP